MDVSAKITSGDAAGKSVTVKYDIPEGLDELVKKFTDKVVVAHVRSSFIIALQSLLRGLLKAGKSPADVQKAVNEWKPGLRTPGKSTMDKIKDNVSKLSAEDKAALLKQLKEDLAKK